MNKNKKWKEVKEMEAIEKSEKDVEIEGKKYGPGSYFYRPPAIEHGPFKAGEKEWIVFCAFDGPIGIEEAIGMSIVK